MRTVLVVGPGGSFAQASSTRPSRTLWHPPLDANFFDRTLAIKDRDQELTDSVSEFLTALAKTDGFANPWTATTAASLEQFFADVYEVAKWWPGSRIRLVCGAAQLVRARVLGATTNWMRNTTKGVTFSAASRGCLAGAAS
jgi:hypothetical protein